MSEWEVRLLGEVAKVERGTMITRKQVTPGLVPVIAGGQTPSCYHNVANRTGETITVSASGANAGFVQFFDYPIFASDCSTVVAKDRQEVNSKFLFYTLLNKQNEIYSLQKGTGQPHVYASQLVDLNVLVPPIEEQIRIVEILEEHLSRIDSALEDVKQAREKADQFRRSLLHAAFAGKFHKGKIDPNLGFRTNWTKTTLSEVASWTSGGTPPSKDPSMYDGDVPWVVIGDLTESEVKVTAKSITQKGLDSSSAKLMPEGTVMLAMYGASIGRTGIMSMEMATNQAIACAVPDEKLIFAKFLLYFLQSQKEAFVNAGQGGAQPNISQTIIKAWPISLPPLEDQGEIIDLIEDGLKLIDRSNEKINFLDVNILRLKRSLLQAAFTGQLTKEDANV